MRKQRGAIPIEEALPIAKQIADCEGLRDKKNLDANWSHVQDV